MNAQPNTLPKGTLPCAVCGKPTSLVLMGRAICDDCVDAASDDEVRIYRKSFKVVQGGLPR